MDPALLRKASDRTAPAYDARFGALQRVKYDTILGTPHGVAARVDLQGGAWLDAGCGTGLFAEHIGAAGCTGVDLSAQMLLRAGSRGIRPVQADIDALPFGAESFDAVFSFTALVDRTSAAPALSELARVARPGAVVVVTLLPHDLPDDLYRVARAAGLVEEARLACGQDLGCTWRKGGRRS